jgi:DNA polymerase-3 subunit beta
MLVKLSSSVLGSSLRDILGIVPSHPSSPILGAVLVTAGEDGIWLWGTDLDVSGRFIVEGMVETPGRTAIPAKRLMETVRQLPADEELILEIKEGRVEIRCGRSRFLMPVMPEEEFPVFPELGSPDKVVFPSETLERLVNGTAFAAGREESRPGLNSVLWELIDQGMSMVATDGRRLAWMKIGLKEPTRLERKFILPPKALNQAVKLSTASEEVTVGFGDRFVSFEFPGAVLYTRELDTAYPSYSTVIPKETRLEMSVSRVDVIAALRRAVIFAMPLTSQIRMDLDEGKLVIHAECPEVGEATEELDVEYSGERFGIGFNGKYLLDILSHIDGEKVIFRMNAPLKAALIVPENVEEDISYTCLLMPLRLNE